MIKFVTSRTTLASDILYCQLIEYYYTFNCRGPHMALLRKQTHFGLSIFYIRMTILKSLLCYIRPSFICGIYRAFSAVIPPIQVQYVTNDEICFTPLTGLTS